MAPPPAYVLIVGPQAATHGTATAPHPGPPAKGEGNCSRAIWPQELKKNVCTCNSFSAWLNVEMSKKKTNLTRPYQCLGRFMGMLEAGPGAQHSSFPSVHDTTYWLRTWCRRHMLEVNHAKKEKQYRLKLRTFPLQEHREAAVTNSCLIMKCIAKAYADQAAMPLTHWALCNSGADGCIYNTTHGGRNKEWVIADLQYVRVLLAERKGCMECTEHKTWKTYGDLAKWLSPTLIGYLLCYDSCPKPEGHSTLSVPAKAGATHMSMQSALRTWFKKAHSRWLHQANCECLQKAFTHSTN
jgi:hypothetical protein